MDSDRSLSSGISIPQWMKSKMIDNRLDLDESSFSPGNDDSFLYFKYPRKSRDDGRLANEISESIDTSRHTAPCRQVIAGVTPTVTKQLKSNGTDDGFKGKSAACGTSIVKVAHQMVSEKRLQQEPQREVVEFPTGFDPTVRRASRSLPASPLASPSSSPKSHRRLFNTTTSNHNKYFTAAFAEGERNGSWILSGLLGKRDALSRSVSVVVEETGSVPDLTSVGEEMRTSKKPVTQVFKARPSELREMNFWSPTSM